MSTHTPGPWESVLEDDGVTDSVTFVIRMGSHLCGKNGWEPQHRIEYEVSSKQGSPKQFAEAKANARLIASSPDLLAALKALRGNVADLRHCECIKFEREGSDNCDIETVDQRCAICRAADDAILKAEGGHE